MANAHRICQSLGIRLHARHDPHPGKDRLPPKHTWARQAIKLVAESGEKTGNPNMIYDVLSVFLASEDNSRCLRGDMISGVAEWFKAHGVSGAEASLLLPMFRTLDLATIWQAVEHHGIPRKSAQIAFLVASQMEDALVTVRRPLAA